MTNFDKVYNRRGSRSVKWLEPPEGGVPLGTIPMFIAEMDFPPPPSVLEAIDKRIAEGFYGYDVEPAGYYDAVIKHFKDCYNFDVKKEWIVNIPSVMPGVNIALRVANGTFMYTVPMYNHIRRMDKESHLPVIEVPMKIVDDFFYMDFEAMEKMITPETKAFLLCNPHNPVGRIFTQEELDEVTEFCKRHNLLLISDEIHCELALDGKHIPAFAINEWALNNSITLTSAGKICNIPGIPSGVAVIPDDELRAKFKDISAGLWANDNTVSYSALKAAWDGSCEDWKEELREYLRGNRDYLEERIAAMPKLKVYHSQATYLAWVDCSGLGLENPFDFFNKEARVFFGPGAAYGNSQFVRVNYGCPRSRLVEALDRVEAAIKTLE